MTLQEHFRSSTQFVVSNVHKHFYVRHIFILLLSVLALHLPHHVSGQQFIDSSRGYSISFREDQQYFLHYPTHLGKAPVSLDSLLHLSEPMEAALFLRGIEEHLYLKFVNDRVGFIYGYSIQYGYVNRVYHTSDGGNTWMLAKVDGKGNTLNSYLNVHLQKEFLQMMDERNGFLVSVFRPLPRNSEFHYYTTSNGGTDWTLRKVSLRSPGYMVHHNATKVSVGPDGNITVSLELVYNVPQAPGKNARTPQPRHIVLTSSDRGRTFNTMMPW